MGTLYIVGTPIGNMEDITFRAISTLKSVDLVLAEDTRNTKKILDRYGIEKRLMSFHHHSKISRFDFVIESLSSGLNIALVTDAGTPGVSDPGNELLELVWAEVAEGRDIRIVPIPGVSAVTTLLSVSGFPTDDFVFLGFLPKKKGRQTLLGELIGEKRTMVIFESPHRIIKTLNELLSLFGDREVVVGRELTKKFEEIQRGRISRILQVFDGRGVKGEITLLLRGGR